MRPPTRVGGPCGHFALVCSKLGPSFTVVGSKLVAVSGPARPPSLPPKTVRPPIGGTCGHLALVWSKLGPSFTVFKTCCVRPRETPAAAAEDRASTYWWYVRSPCFILFKIGSLLWNLEFFFQNFFILESSIFRSNTVTVRKKKLIFFLHRKRHVTSQWSFLFNYIDGGQ